jgi:hypothetical protein
MEPLISNSMNLFAMDIAKPEEAIKMMSNIDFRNSFSVSTAGR